MNRVIEMTDRVTGIIITAAALTVSQHWAAAQAGGPSSADAPSSQESHPLDPALRMAQESLRHIQANVQDCTAVLIKRLRNDGELTEHQYAFVKIRHRRTKNGRVTTPMAVYLKFLKPNSVKGREVIWVENKFNGRLIAHEGGFKNLIRVKLDPKGSLAMRGQRYPISDIGLENLIRKVVESGKRDRRYRECEVRFFGNAKINDNVCTVMQVNHPVRRPYFDFCVARVFFDDKLKVPIRYESWSWPTEKGGKLVLEEEYTYTDVKLNVGLSDIDFDPDNSEYNFP